MASALEWLKFYMIILICLDERDDSNCSIQAIPIL